MASALHITVCTDRQFGLRSSSLTKLGRVTEEDRTISEPSKRVRIRCIVSPLGALKISGKCNPRGKKSPEQLERVYPSLKVDRTENLPQMLKIW